MPKSVLVHNTRVGAQKRLVWVCKRGNVSRACSIIVLHQHGALLRLGEHMQRVRARNHFVGNHDAALGGALHRVDVVLVRVAAGQEEVGERRGLGVSTRVLARFFAVQGLAELHHAAPGAGQLLGAGKELVHLGQRVGDDLLHRPVVRAAVHHRLKCVHGACTHIADRMT